MSSDYIKQHQNKPVISRQTIIFIFLTTLLVFPLGWYVGKNVDLSHTTSLVDPLIKHQQPPKELPLLKYTIPALAAYPYQTSRVVTEELIETTPRYSSYVFSYRTTDRTMSGQLIVPELETGEEAKGIIVMLRGWAPAETYQPGVGTHSAAEVFASNGYITLAPDFLGYGQSDSDLNDPWESRFIKPVQVIELIKTLQQQTAINLPADAPLPSVSVPQNMGMWAHSNGGQIALTTLEVLQQPIPTTLWAPVTAPFPYSILYFGDEQADEGKEQRAWIGLFDDDYDARQFSLTQYLNQLAAPLQIHQGQADEAIHFVWNKELVEKLEAENEKRQAVLATQSAAIATGAAQPVHQPINVTYYQYPSADHNLRPDWDSAVQRDLSFFNSYF